MSIFTMLETMKTKDDNDIVDILRILLEGGANVHDAEKFLVQESLERSPLKVLETLFEYGMHPKFLSVYPGDTPMHAALMIGLQKHKENFGILKCFIKRYHRLKTMVPDLNPSQVDKYGNNLFHLVAKETDCTITHVATKLLAGLNIPVWCKNKEGKLPSDYLKCDHEDILEIYQNMEQNINQLIEMIYTSINAISEETRLSMTEEILLQDDENIGVAEGEDGASKADLCKEENIDTEKHTDFNPQIFANLSWEIQCTKNFLKAITNRNVHPPLRRKAVNLIIQLGEGMRMKHLCKKLRNSNPSGPVLYEIKVDSAVRIIWEKAIDISNKPQAHEVIRLWDLVLNHDRIHDSVQNITKSYDRAKLSQPLSRCIKRNLCKDSHMENPQTFQCMNPENKSDPDVDCLYHPVNPNEQEFSVIKFHDFSFDVASYINENPDMDVDFPFNVTHLEDALINMSSISPILLIGRSGTGKTTCCLYRIWTRYKKYCMHIQSTETSLASNIETSCQLEENTNVKEIETQDEAEQNSPVCGSKQEDQIKEDEANENGNKSTETACCSDTRFRQIFVTKNQLLCMEVQRNFLEFRNASSIGKKYPSLKNPQSLPVKLQEIEDFQYPLFLFYKNLLELLDNSIGDPKYFSRDKRIKIKSEIQGWSDLNKEEDLSKYKQPNSNFDIISEDELSELSSDDEQECSLQIKTNLKRKRGKIESKKIMTYDVFEKETWKRIKDKNCKYDPSLVYTEIMSFIKGSYEALESPTGFLNFEEYVNLGKKMAPMFTEERGKIYEMFKAYEQEKQQSSYIDEADITKDLYNRLTKHRNRDILVDEVYVDEAQDFTQAEICVLILLCRSPNRIFLTGDTAQCIVRGTAFRFIDIKSLFHSLAEKHKSRRIQVPKKIYHLPHNYRSHSGILNMASSVLELMEDFFPESYDKLEKDIGMLPGPKPVLLESDLRDLPLLLNASKRDTSRIELGAHQVILVFKEETKEEAQCLFNKSLVMTIDRAKGLEFDDVLLFNFFRDSYAKKEWRTVTAYLNEISNNPDSLPASLPSVIEIQYDNMMQRRAIAFDRTKHKVLNTELKLLYTAITRARANVWIFDEDKESREPMYYYFQKRGLVETNIQDFKTRSFAKPSTNTEWMKEGECLFRQKRFEEAAKCYENGENTAMAEYATARHREERASYLTANSAVQYNLLWATLGYLKCQRLKRATRCLKRISENKLLAMLYEKSNRIKKAANVYGNNDMPIDQSRCLEQLVYFGKALQVLVDKGHFEEAHRCLERYNSHQESKDPIPKHLESKDKIDYKAAKYFGMMGKKDCMMTYAQRISVEKRIDVFKSCDFIQEAEDLLLQEGMDKELVELYMRNGNIQKALHHLYKTDPSNRKLRNECIIIEAQIAVQCLKERNIDLKYLNEIINDANPDAPFKARAYLLRGLLTESQNDVYTAFNEFGDELPGQLECIGWIMHRIHLNQIEDIQNILKILGELNPPYRDLLNKDSLRKHDFLNSNYTFYGFYGDVNDKYKVYPRQAPIAVNICNLSKEKIEVRLKGEIVREDVLDFVVKKTKGWNQKLEGLINSQKKTTGEQLQISTDKKLSETLDRSEESSTDALFQVVRFHMLSIELNFISQGVERKRCEELLKTLVSFNAINTFSEHDADSSNLLCSLLRNFHDKVMKNAIEENLHEINEGIQNSQRNAIKSFIEIILLQKAMMLEEIDIGEMLSSYETKMLNKYKKQYFFDFRKSKRNDPEIQKVRKKAKEDGVDIADKKGKYVLQFMARPLLETLEKINKCDTARACVCFNEFCFLLLKRDRFEISWDIFLLLSEYIVTISNIYAIRENHQLAVIFPHSYISRMHFVETLFLKTGSVCELQKQKSKGKSKQSKIINIQHLICLLCGYSGKGNILKAARESKTAPKHVFERVLVLCFVVLCNLGKYEINSDGFAIIKESVAELVAEVAYSLQFSKEVIVLKQLQTSFKTSDFVKSLSAIEKKHGVSLKVCTWKSGIDIQNFESFEKIESILKSFDLSDETLKAIQSPVKDPKIKAEVSAEKVENTKTSISENTTYEEEFALLPKLKGPHLMDKKDIKQQSFEGIGSILKSFDLRDETLKAIQSPVKDPKIKEVSVEKVEDTKTAISENTTYEEEFALSPKLKVPHLMDKKDIKQQKTCEQNVPPVHISSKDVSKKENFRLTYTILYQRIPEIQIRRNLLESIPGG